ncbi:hypothetical protein N7450_001955 [Penicillium hetheringtonii]|uniref:non-specific serine/threonine protein kinase n=1 Tax=Penicillium hetheringtonii TaxID=911720 RepID=A0AAD6H2V5_9EURO|nr:hypothetical protein N7450_001955 [Penicillium hetheringtonii]
MEGVDLTKVLNKGKQMASNVAASATNGNGAAGKKKRKGTDLKPILTSDANPGATESTGAASAAKSSAPSRSPSTSSGDELETTAEEEDSEDYCKGGYHPVAVGESYNNGRYVVVRKLGWGHFSTVWLSRDTTTGKHVALKVVRSAAHYTETAIDEIKLLNRIVQAKPSHPGRKHVVSLLDSFEHKGPNGVHVCMVFEVLGENLLGLIKRWNHRGIPMVLVKQITKQVLLGLDYLHRECGIIHTDLKPENVLIEIGDVEQIVQAHVKQEQAKKDKEDNRNGRRRRRTLITGSQPLPSPLNTSFSSFDFKHSSSNSHSSLSQMVNEASEEPPSMKESLGIKEQDEQQSQREKTADLLEREVSGISLNKTSQPEDEIDPNIISVKIADLGNACWVDTTIPFPEVLLGAKWGASTDVWSMACMLFCDFAILAALLTDWDRSSSLSPETTYLTPQSGTKYGKDDDHIAQIIELLGPFAKSQCLSGKWSQEIFNRKGELRNIHRLRHWALPEVLREKYHYSVEQSMRISEFLLPMLDLSPEKRANAGGMASHEWLADTLGMEGISLGIQPGTRGEGIDGWASEIKRR